MGRRVESTEICLPSEGYQDKWKEEEGGGEVFMCFHESVTAEAYWEIRVKN